MYTACTHLS